jgi:hypothetical protein
MPKSPVRYEYSVKRIKACRVLLLSAIALSTRLSYRFANDLNNAFWTMS